MFQKLSNPLENEDNPQANDPTEDDLVDPPEDHVADLDTVRFKTTSFPCTGVSPTLSPTLWCERVVKFSPSLPDQAYLLSPPLSYPFSHPFIPHALLLVLSSRSSMCCLSILFCANCAFFLAFLLFFFLPSAFPISCFTSITPLSCPAPCSYPQDMSIAGGPLPIHAGRDIVIHLLFTVNQVCSLDFYSILIPNYTYFDLGPFLFLLCNLIFALLYLFYFDFYFCDFSSCMNYSLFFLHSF